MSASVLEAIERMALVCHIGSRVHYVLDLSLIHISEPTRPY